MSLIRIVTGSESFAHGTSGLLVQVVACNGLPVPDGRMFISDAAKRGINGIRLPAGRTMYLPASRHGVKEQGNWFDGNFELPEGTVLRLFGRRQERVGGRGGSLRNPQRGVVYIRIRDEAALRRLTLNTIDDPHSSDVPVAVEGRYDVLSLREAGALGVPLMNEDMLCAKVDAVRGVLVHEELSSQRQAPAKTQRETVSTHDGEQVVVQTRRTPRAINLDE